MHKLCICFVRPGTLGRGNFNMLGKDKNYSSKCAEEKNYMVIMQQLRSKMKIPSDVLLIPYAA